MSSSDATNPNNFWLDSSISSNQTFLDCSSSPEIYNNIAYVLPSGAKIALCVDNSGSMTVGTVQASVNYFVEQATAAGVTIFAPSGGNTTYNCNGMGGEDWITGHIVAMD